MSDTHGRFVWYELMTTDLAAARAFYTQVVGWQARDSQMPGMEYWMFEAGGTPVAGLMAQPEDVRQAGAPPSWNGFVAVDDVDAAAAKVTASGGTLHVPPRDIPNVGRFAIMADPQGAVLGLLKAANPDQGPRPQEPGAGRVGWHELYAVDQASVFASYAGLFGWQKEEAMDMGPMGVYQTFGLGGQMIGGMMNKPPEMPVAHWNYYFGVDSIEAAIERVKAAGGQVVFGPQEVPGGAFVMMGIDPQGGSFALLGGR
ncbi:MAG TPA: VOC family protein [Chloroflexota bacterium]|nr:VOC family protein [Chloroflexota bacterium]